MSPTIPRQSPTIPRLVILFILLGAYVVVLVSFCKVIFDTYHIETFILLEEVSFTRLLQNFNLTQFKRKDFDPKKVIV